MNEQSLFTHPMLTESPLVPSSKFLHLKWLLCRRSTRIPFHDFFYVAFIILQWSLLCVICLLPLEGKKLREVKASGFVRCSLISPCQGHGGVLTGWSALSPHLHLSPHQDTPPNPLRPRAAPCIFSQRKPPGPTSTLV